MRRFGSIGMVLLTLVSCSQSNLGPLIPTLAPFQKQGATAPSDILLVTVDTWRHDAAGFMGSPGAKTPFIDQLAIGGLVFVNAYAHTTVTLPSHASLLTGLLPYRHGLRDNAGYRLSPKIPTLAGLLRSNGYVTGAFISAFPLDSRYGLGHDFDHYDDFIDRYAEPLAKVTERPGSETIARAQTWLAKPTSKPKFAWIHLYEPHYPYAPPEPYKSTFAEQPYLGEVAYVDQLLSDFLGPYLHGEKTATILLTSDHGEGLGDHGEATHGLFAYESTIRVPLILWSPDRLKAGRIDTRIGHIDVVPTLLDLHQLPSQASFDGQSLLVGRPTPTIYFESLSTYINRGWAPLRGCIQQGHKAIELPIVELYNLDTDPQEAINLAASQKERLKSCLSCLPSNSLLMGDRQSLSTEEREKLAALGYASAPGGTHKPTGLQSDPKNLVEVDREIYKAFGMAAKGQYQTASVQLETLIQDHPEIELAYQYASDYAYQSGKLERAIRLLDLAFQRGVASELSQRKLALYLIEANRLETASHILAIWADSQDPETHSALGKLFTHQGQMDKAHKSFQRALSLDPSNPSVWAEIGTMHLFGKKLALARQAFTKALSQNDRNADAWNGLGVVHAQSSEIPNAIEAWEKALAINPRMAFCHRNLANIYEKRGNLQKARTHLRAYADLVQGEQKTRALTRLQGLQ